MANLVPGLLQTQVTSVAEDEEYLGDDLEGMEPQLAPNEDLYIKVQNLCACAWV